MTLLRIDASARHDGSVTRTLADRIEERLGAADVIRRDLADHPIPHVSGDWIAGAYSDPNARSDAQRAALEVSDALTSELKRADTLLIAMPIYNFGPPAALKAWIDQVARVGVTFRYTETGPEGLLGDRRTIVTVASGGTEMDGAGDYATPWLRSALGLMGIESIEFVAADRQMMDENAIPEAEAEIDRLAA